MIGYITLGTNNLEQATGFYDALFTDLGINRVHSSDRMSVWMKDSQPMFSVILPFDKQTATAGNGSMIALLADSKDQVDSFHAKALSLGAHNEGDPGKRAGGLYCAYFRDLDGNKLNFYYPDF